MNEADSDEWRAYRDRHKPTDEEWAAVKSFFTSGVVARGVVLSHHRFGFFVDLGDSVVGLVEIPRVKDPGQTASPEDYPAVGQEITTVVLGVVDLQRQVHLSIRPSDLKAATASVGVYAGWRPAPLPDPWVIVPSVLRADLEAELKAEIAEGHELSGLPVTAIARCGACDDVVFCIETSPIWFALVHLTWRQRPEQPPRPMTTRLSLPLSARLKAHRHPA